MQLWRSSILRQMTLLPLLLLLFGGIAVGNGALVLCVGADGHVELELGSFGECCASEVPSVGQLADPGPSLAACEGGCGECRDLPLESHALGARRPEADARTLDLELPIECLDLRDGDLTTHCAAVRTARSREPMVLRPTLPILRI